MPVPEVPSTMVDLRDLTEQLLRFESLPGNEAPAQRFVRETLDGWGFETYEWTADAERLASHPSFPDDPAEIDGTDRPSVAGVYELSGEGPTLVLNGHIDVVPAPGEWSSPPFEPTWHTSDGETLLTARGAADMKAGLAACLVAARRISERAGADATGRIVVESVSGEEEGGIGAAAAALESPYSSPPDAAIVAEPTDLRPIVACEGSLMGELTLRGRSAHAATRWRGESVLPHFERVRQALVDLERERCERVTHPLYERYPTAWPISVGTVRAGSWPSTVPADLTAGIRVGVAPGETVAAVERTLRERLAAVANNDPWLVDHPPTFERRGIQFEPSELSPDEPVVRAVRRALDTRGLPHAPTGATYGADARHYIGAGIPAVLFGPGSVEQAHFPDETVRWRDVERAADCLVAAALDYLSR